MIFSSICVQINTMFTKKEFKVAAVIALFYSCFAFAFTLTEFSGIDINPLCFNIDIIQSVEIALAKILSELVYLAILSIGITLYICRTDIF